MKSKGSDGVGVMQGIEHRTIRMSNELCAGQETELGAIEAVARAELVGFGLKHVHLLARTTGGRERTDDESGESDESKMAGHEVASEVGERRLIQDPERPEQGTATCLTFAPPPAYRRTPSACL